MEIRKFLDVATGHLTPSDAALLTEGSAELAEFPLTVAAYEFGWIVSTAPLIDARDRREQIQQLRLFGFSDAFVTIAVRAGREGCWLLRFDREEDLDEKLPIGGYGLREQGSPASDDYGSTMEALVDRGAGVDSACFSMPSQIFDHLWALRERHGDDPEAAVSEWRRFLVEKDRERVLSADLRLPAFRICPEWGHYFAENVPESTVRWVFDRRSWTLARLEILDEATATWRAATDEERFDVDESLIVANSGALTDEADDWGCVDTDALPSANSWEFLSRERD